MKNKYNVRQKTAELSASMTDKEMFLSEQFHDYAEGLISSIVRRPRGQIKLDIEFAKKSDKTAATDGNQIVANLGHELIQSFATQRGRFAAALGMIFHECAHIAYYDFAKGERCMDEYVAGRLSGGMPKTTSADLREARDGIEKLLKSPMGRRVVVDIIATIDNCIIDAHDEMCLCRRGGPLVGHSIRLLADNLKHRVKTVEWLTKKGVNDLSVIFNLVLSYARWGCYIVEDEAVLATDERVKQVRTMEPFLDRAKVLDDAESRFPLYNECLLRLWPTLKQFADDATSAQDDQSPQPQGEGDKSERSDGNSSTGESKPSDGSAASDGEKSNSEDGSSNGSKAPDGNSSAGDSETSNQGEPFGNNTSSDGDESSDEGNSYDEGKPSDGDESSNDGKPSGKDTSSDGSTPSDKGDATDGSETSDGNGSQSDGSGNPSNGGKNSEASNQIGESTLEEILNALQQGKDASAQSEPPKNTKGTTESPQAPHAEESDSSADEQGDEMAAAAAEQIIRVVAGNKAEEKISDQIYADTLVEVNAAPRTSSHAGYRIKMNACRCENEEKHRYREVMAEISPYSKALQRTIERAIKLRQDDDVQHHRIYGKKVSARDTYRRDSRFFDKKKDPGNPADMAIAILIDRSGSMRGNRIYSAVKAASLVYDFARGLHIPVMVMGHHSSVDKKIEMYLNATFVPRKGDKYRILDTRTHNSNRDGMAIQVAADVLSKRPEEVKLLIIVSDGMPNDTDYGGEPAKKDIQDIVASYARKGVSTIATAIGGDKERIRSIYGDGFVDISDLSAFPKKLCKLIAKRIDA